MLHSFIEILRVVKLYVPACFYYFLGNFVDIITYSLVYFAVFECISTCRHIVKDVLKGILCLWLLVFFHCTGVVIRAFCGEFLSFGVLNLFSSCTCIRGPTVSSLLRLTLSLPWVSFGWFAEEENDRTLKKPTTFWFLGFFSLCLGYFTSDLFTLKSSVLDIFCLYILF